MRNIIHTQNLWELHGNYFNIINAEVIEEFQNKLNKSQFLTHFLELSYWNFHVCCTVFAVQKKIILLHDITILQWLLTVNDYSSCWRSKRQYSWLQFFPSILFLVFFLQEVFKWKYSEVYLAKYSITTFTVSQAGLNKCSMNIRYHVLISSPQ